MNQGWILFFCMLLAGQFLMFGSEAVAQDVKAMLSEANTELRQAEKDMFDGKSENAIAALQPLKEKIDRIKGADPNNPTLKALEGKYNKLVKDLERRTGKNLGGETQTAAGESTQPKVPAQPEVKPMAEKPAPVTTPAAAAAPAKEPTSAQPQTAKVEQGGPLPYHARGPIQEAERSMEQLDRAIQNLSDPSFDKDQLVKGMGTTLENARKNLEAGKAKAAEQGVTSHLKFDELEAKITAAEKQIADAKAGQETAKATQKVEADEVQRDVKALMDDYKRVQPLFDQSAGVAIYYNDLTPVKELLAQVEAFEKTEQDKLKSRLEGFAAKYGSTSDEVDKKAEEMGYSDPYYRASFPYTEILKGMENVRKTRTAMAEDLVRRATEMKSHTSKGIHDFARMEQYDELREWGRAATGFEGENPQVKEFNSGLEGWITEDMGAFNAKIDQAVFPKQAGDAPADAPVLVKAAKEFLQKEEDERAARGKISGQVMAVVITGPWQVFKKNLLGEPIQYNLPVASAVQIEKEKGQNLTRVYHGSMLTQEMTGVKTAPPFFGVAVGDSYYVRSSALK